MQSVAHEISDLQTFSNPKKLYQLSFQAAEQLKEVLKVFIEKESRYQGRDLYIAGVSYAGVYLPTLATKIIAEGDSFPLKLKVTLFATNKQSKVSENDDIEYACSRRFQSLYRVYERRMLVENASHALPLHAITFLRTYLIFLMPYIHLSRQAESFCDTNLF